MNSDQEKWIKIEDFFKQNFSDGESIDLDAMLFLIGVQELGKGNLNFKKDDKLNLIHIAVCKLLEPFGFYRFDGFTEDGWPMYENIKKLPELKANEQTILMKQAIINYFEQEQLI
ncbi:MAG: hypothetical protein H6604_06360 [Flavobacteriales bacterium]|nr:hypothetical protein [Flavobacteriales bacterium]